MIRKIAKLVLAITIIGLLFSCSEDKEEEDERPVPDELIKTFVFECDSTFSFTVQLINEKAKVILPEKTYELKHVEAASGAKYSDGEITFWTKGEEAFLELKDTTYRNCVNNGVAAVWEKAKLSGVDFRASGFEPGWHLEIKNDEKTLFVTNYGNERYEFVTPKPEVNDETGETIYHFNKRNIKLTATIKDEECTDPKGDKYNLTAYIEFGGNNLRGCGKNLRDVKNVETQEN